MSEHRPVRTSRWWNVVAPVVVVILGVAIAVALANRKLEPRQDFTRAGDPVVDTQAVRKHVGRLDIEVDGLVTPYREVTLSAEVEGRVVYKSPECRAGRFVKQGSLLLEIDPQSYELEVQRLEQQLQNAEAAIGELEVELTNCAAMIDSSKEELELQQKELRRVINLGAAVSEAEVDKARRGEWASRNSLLNLRNQAQLAETRRTGLERLRDLANAQLGKARLDLRRTKILAPFDGVILRDGIEQDSYAQKGTPLATLDDTSRVEVRCSLTMADLLWIWGRQPVDAAGAADQLAVNSGTDAIPSRPGPVHPAANSRPVSQATTAMPENRSVYDLPQVPATVIFSPTVGGARYVWGGHLARYDGLGLDERTRTVPCRIAVPNPLGVTTDVVPGHVAAGTGPQALVRGMYVEVLLHVEPPADVFQVPEAALYPGKRLYCVRDGALKLIGPVTTLRLVRGVDNATGRGESYWLIHDSSSSLLPGDRVVVSPLTGAFDGMKVKEASLDRKADSAMRAVREDES